MTVKLTLEDTDAVLLMEFIEDHALAAGRSYPDTVAAEVHEAINYQLYAKETK